MRNNGAKTKRFSRTDDEAGDQQSLGSGSCPEGASTRPAAELDWDFEEFEDIAHPPSKELKGISQPPPKKPEVGAGPRARAKELSNAFGHALPVRSSDGENDSAVFLTGPPPVPLRDVFALNAPTLRHIPGGARPRIQLALSRVLRGFVNRLDAVSFWMVMAFPKLVLRATGDPRAHQGLDVSQVVLTRLDLWEAGSFRDLWDQAKKEVEKPSKKGAQAPPQPTAKKIDEKMVSSMRALVADGAPRKALNLLSSNGLHSVGDPEVLAKLQALHPAGNPLNMSALPQVVDHGLPPLEDLKFWSQAVLKGVADFPRGSAPGPSGLRPSCLYDLLKRGPHVSKIVVELAALVALAAHGKFPAELAPTFGAATLVPLRKPDGGVRPIAIGETFRRLVGKSLMHLPKLMGELRALAPLQF